MAAIKPPVGGEAVDESFRPQTVIGRTPSFKRMAQFGAVGVLGFAADLGLTLYLIQYVGLTAALARLPAFLGASVVTYLINRYWTFEEAEKRSLIKGWLKYISATGVGALLNFATYSLVLLASEESLALVCTAVVAGSLSGMTFNYLAASRWVFKPFLRDYGTNAQVGSSLKIHIDDENSRSR